MYIQLAQGKCDNQTEMRRLVDEWSTAMADQQGWIGGTFGFTDDNRFVGVVRYESAEACQRLMDTETSRAGMQRADALCEGGIELHEAGDVSMMLDGGSDRAGFVQVMRGHIGDSGSVRHLASDEMTSMLHQARPEIIGATLAIEPDGSFTETIAFTDEVSARRGEQQEMPEDVRGELTRAFTDVEYLDLHRPWFASHR